MTDRAIKYVDLDEIREDPRNPKGHAEDLIDESITIHGLIEPVQLDERTGQLIGGHGRLHQLRTMRDSGRPAPDGIRVKGGRWLMPVVTGWASRDDDQAARALVVLNQVGPAGGWLRDPLLALLGEMPTLEGTGFRSLDELPPLPETPYPAQGPPVAPYRPKRPPAATRRSVVRVLEGDCVEVLAGLEADSVDAVVCDPPYEIGFMGKSWDDSGVAYRPSTWAAVLRVLKPGGHLLAFGGTRTYHRMGVAIEDAGFEVRDSIHWIYGSGFPKSLDVSKAVDEKLGAERERGPRVGGALNAGTANGWAGSSPDSVTAPLAGTQQIGPAVTPEGERWEGWGTALKPAHEPIIVARKPLAGTVAETVLAYGTGGLNVDGTRVEGEAWASVAPNVGGRSGGIMGEPAPHPGGDPDPGGRWPPNVVLDEVAAAEMDRQSGDTPPSRVGPSGPTPDERVAYGKMGAPRPERGYEDSGGASRFFPVFRYEAKASTAERNAGLDQPEEALANVHATVKPVELMRWLVRLVTPPGGVVLDPFAGSGTTLVAAVLEGFDAIGVELTAEYLPIIEGRVAWAHAQIEDEPSDL